MSTELSAQNFNESAVSEAGAIACMQHSLLLSNVTATALVHKVYANTTMSAARVNFFIETFLPKVIEFRLHLLQANEVLRRPHPIVGRAETIFVLPTAYSVMSGSNHVISIDINFGSEFQHFYENILVHIIAPKMQTLFMGLQDLKQQIGIANVFETYELVRALPEEGIAVLGDYAWAAKSKLVDMALTKSFKLPVHDRIKLIPLAIQEALINPNSSVVHHFLNAQTALRQSLLLDMNSQQQVFQTIPIVELENIPRLTKIMQRAALLYAQSQNFRASRQVLKFQLMFGGPDIEGYEAEIYWMNVKLNIVLQNSKTLPWLVTDRFLDTIIELPLIPCSIEHMNRSREYHNDGCFNMVMQEKNIDELVIGFDAIAAHQPLPQLNFTTPGAHLMPIATCRYLPDLTTVGIGLGIAFTMGLTAYITKSWCGSSRFWYHRLSLKKDKQEPADRSFYHAVPVSEPSRVSHRK
jgi:hypothetical protein